MQTNQTIVRLICIVSSDLLGDTSTEMKPKTKVRMTFLLLDLMDLLEDAVFLATRPGYRRLSAYWGYVELRGAYRAFERAEAEKYLVKFYQGEQILYRLHERGRELLQIERPSPALRKRAWDGRWRIVMFDFPEVARKARNSFRQKLHEHRMGCLQKSVWITPDPIIPTWKRLLRETELTEWVLLFESSELGPVDDVEIAQKVWPLAEVDKRYQLYLSEFRDLPRKLHASSSSALSRELGRRARKESEKYFDILRDDPCLPLSLVPDGFHGREADALHREVRTALRRLIFEEGR